jgi:hypothetical protein
MVEIEGPVEVMPTPKNLAIGKPVTVSGEWSGRAALKKENLTDGRLNTIWAGPENSRSGWAQVDLGEEFPISAAFVSEGPDYKRCAKFEVQAQLGGEWKTVASGTGIGARKDLIFGPVKARVFRLAVTVDKPAGLPNGEPVIAEFRLFSN